MDEVLRTAVETQAAAHASGDAVRFASYIAPGAFVELGRDLAAARGVRIRRFTVIDITMNDTGGTSRVRFAGRGSYVIVETWERGDAGWRAVSAHCPAESVRRPWWSRLPLVGRRPAIPEREELA